MGYGKEYKCSKCGNEYGYGVGAGFLFPMVYQELLASVKEGKSNYILFSKMASLIYPPYIPSQ
ncbi:MAG: hypothetical protein IKI20_03805 [Lachnospiraceae bacterium]|nr:hypothetical protein [Lachnospiraceae bacterium]